MPQLNPTPWLLVMVMTWLTISVMLTLVNNINLINDLLTSTEPNNKTKQMSIWAWPW